MPRGNLAPEQADPAAADDRQPYLLRFTVSHDTPVGGLSSP
jgi:hypothetical protein